MMTQLGIVVVNSRSEVKIDSNNILSSYSVLRISCYQPRAVCHVRNAFSSHIKEHAQLFTTLLSFSFPFQVYQHFYDSLKGGLRFPNCNGKEKEEANETMVLVSFFLRVLIYFDIGRESFQSWVSLRPSLYFEL